MIEKCSSGCAPSSNKCAYDAIRSSTELGRVLSSPLRKRRRAKQSTAEGSLIDSIRRFRGRFVKELQFSFRGTEISVGQPSQQLLL